MKRTMNVASRPVDPAAWRRSRGRTRDDAMFPICSLIADTPDDCGATFDDIKLEVLVRPIWQNRQLISESMEGGRKVEAQIGLGVRRCT